MRFCAMVIILFGLQRGSFSAEWYVIVFSLGSLAVSWGVVVVEVALFCEVNYLMFLGWLLPLQSCSLRDCRQLAAAYGYDVVVFLVVFEVFCGLL